MKTTNEFVRKFSLAAALLGVAASARASGDGVDVFTIQGTVNFSSTQGAAVNNTFGITSGESFTGTLTYNSSQTGYYVYGPSGPEIVGYSTAPPLISFTVGGQQFGLYVPDLFVDGRGGGPSWIVTTYADGHSDPGFTAASPWGGFGGQPEGPSEGQFTMTASSGFSPLYPGLPGQSDISGQAWSGEISLAHDFGSVNGQAAGSFDLDAEITSITLAPEPGTMAILGLGAAGWALFRRQVKLSHGRNTDKTRSRKGTIYKEGRKGGRPTTDGDG